MYARVARWEGSTAEDLAKVTEEMQGQTEPPPGVPSKRFLMLTDPDSGRSISIVFFETEEDMRAGDEALSALSPSDDYSGRRTSVEMYEVAVELSTD